MSTSRHLDKICIGAVAILLAITILFMNGKALGIESARYESGYETSLFDTSIVHTIDLVMDDWDTFIENCESEEYSACTAVIDGEKFSNIGLRAKGNTSLSNVKSMDSQRYSFKLEFDQYESGKSYHGLDKLCLNNLIQDSTMMKDYLVYRIMGDFGADAPLCSFVYITVNGEDWGLYLAVEGVEDSFLRRNYGSDTGDLYKPDSMSFGGGRGNGRDFDMDEFRKENFGSSDDSEDADDSENTDNTNQTGTGGQTGSDTAAASGTGAAANAGGMPGGGFGGGNGGGPGGNMGGPGGGMGGGMPGQAGAQNSSETAAGTGAEFAAETAGADGTQAASETGTMYGGPGGNMGGGNMGGPGGTMGGPGGTMGGGNGGGPGGGNAMGSDDVKLKYIDDDPDSYSNIFDSAKTDVKDSDKTRLIASLKSLSEYTDLENILDMDEVLRYFVVHNFVCNGDSYTGSMIHNYYLHEDDGKLGMIPWDYNLAFGTFQAGDASDTVNTSIDSPVSGGDADDRPMVGWIFSDEQYTEMYHELFSEFIEKWFTNGELEALISETAEMIRPYVEKDPTKFYTLEQFDTGVEAISSFVSLRGEAVSRQLDGDTTAVDTGDLDLTDMGGMNNGNGGHGGPEGNQTGYDTAAETADAGQGFMAAPAGENGGTESEAAAGSTGGTAGQQPGADAAGTAGTSAAGDGQNRGRENFDFSSLLTLTAEDGTETTLSELAGESGKFTSLGLSDGTSFDLTSTDPKQWMELDVTKIVSAADSSGNVTDLSEYTISLNVPAGGGDGGQAPGSGGGGMGPGEEGKMTSTPSAGTMAAMTGVSALVLLGGILIAVIKKQR